METRTKTVFATTFALMMAALAAMSFKPATKPLERKIVYSKTTVVTESLHNAEVGMHDPNVYQKFANAWFKKYTFTIDAPDGWRLTGEPFVNCIRDNQGAFGWNNFPAARDRFFVTHRTPTSITVTCWAGSRSIEINVGCEASNE